ncbi:hypothetical protein SAY86_023084 [Trapa natans]|uniref:Uncharacterized protein n=1 Tax=Trapa natans TaxID=22666 RepID=A0AAN7R5E3_TRANT|nr:hypothetical protein SAY86_023084 [Trapa natans]
MLELFTLLNIWKCCQGHLGFELSLVATLIGLVGPALMEQWEASFGISSAGMPIELGEFRGFFKGDRALLGTSNFNSDQKKCALPITTYDWLLCCMFSIHGSLPVVK